MPKVNINYKTGTGRVVWDMEDWVSGMNKEGKTYSMTGRSLILDGVKGGVNPFKNVGALMPCDGPQNLTNYATVTAAITGAATDGYYVYGIGSDAKIQRAIRSTAVISTTGWPVSITAHAGHNTPVGEDIIIYNQGGTDYAFYSWSDNTDGDVGRFNLDATFDDDYMSTVPSGGAVLSTKNYHPMIVALNRLFIGDGNKLHQLINTTYSASKLELPTGYIITSFSLLDSYLIIYAHRQRGTTVERFNATAFIWDFVSPTWDREIPLDDEYVYCGFTWKGIPGCITSGTKNLYSFASNLTKLKLFDGQKFNIVEAIKEHIIPVKNGVTTNENYLLFMASDAVSSTIFCYGSPNPDIAPTLIKTASLIGATPGCLSSWNLGLTTRLWSSTNGDGSTGGRWQVHIAAPAQADCYLLPAWPQLNKRDKMLFTSITIKFFSSSASTGGSLDFNLVVDNLTEKTVFSSLKTTSYNEKKEYRALANGNSLGTAEQAVGAYLKWLAGTDNDFPKIRDIIIDFNIIN